MIIKDIYNKVLFEDDNETTKATVENAMRSRANLQVANLKVANLKGANLKGANLDFSCLPLWCGSSNIKIDERIAKQLASHTFNLIKDFWPTKLFKKQIDWMNDFHRIKSNEFPRFEK